MSYNLGFIDCPTVQDKLENMFLCNQIKREPLPLTAFLFSDLNTNGILEQNIHPGTGKLRTVELVYTPRQLESRTSDSISFACEGGTKPEKHQRHTT